MRSLKIPALDRRAWMPLSLGIVALAMVVARLSAAGIVSQKSAGKTGVDGPIQMPGAVVIAQEPTLAQVLDLVLGESDEADRIASRVRYDPQSDPDVKRVADVLMRHTTDYERAHRIAVALVSEGRRANLGSTLLVGVLLTENPMLEPAATSRVGARGLMQVMPLHAGKWGCDSRDLFDIESNICHGVRILASELRDSGDLSRALLRYNGCVRGTNTPDCKQYARWVYHRAHVSARRGSAIPGVTPFASLDRSVP
jgi:transglycosylase-like protein with SLT domain